MVACNLLRNPALVAKMGATIDVMSGGRLELGLGAGWDEGETTAYGIEFPTARERVERLDEAVQIVKAMWTMPDASFDGRHSRIAGAQCDPKPLQEPHPRVWIGGAGERRTLRVVAEHADCSNFGGSPAAFAHKCEVLDAHCADVGRDPGSIRRTWQHDAFIRETEDEVRSVGSLDIWGAAPDDWRAENLVGTPAQVCDRVRAYIDAGCETFVIWPSDYPSHETLTLFAEHVIPQFR
jgi:alkanesulfonate monooxygenase SsuD/methylene tetrahydromethanopterin reductase-like flavin-dependent oxidoreductase (luciferase family)